ncbi:unnamed protein product, partial [marine sediment metagenome]
MPSISHLLVFVELIVFDTRNSTNSINSRNTTNSRNTINPIA